MTFRPNITTIVLAAIALISLPLAAAAQERPVFHDNGRLTDQVVYTNSSRNAVYYPINLNNNWGLMNQEGQVVVYPRFEWTDYSYDGLARVVVRGRTGFINGELTDDTNPDQYVIPPRFEYADRFCNGLAVVRVEGRWGMIDRAGRVQVPVRYDGMLRMQDGMAAVQVGDRCGFVNRAGDLVIEPRFTRVRSFHDGFAAVLLPNGNWGYIDKRGEVVWHDESGRVVMLGDFHQGVARVQARMRGEQLRWGYITRAFRWRFEPAYEEARDFHNGLAAVRVDGRWGFINAAGRWAVEPRFQDVDSFDDAERSNDFDDDPPEPEDRPGRNLTTAGTYALVQLNGRWGYINRAENAGITPQFTEAEPFFRGLARVGRDGSFAYVTETGQVRFDPRVALELGFIDGRNIERGRVENFNIDQSNNFGRVYEGPPGLTVTDPPEARRASEIPYPPEHEYEETLPVE